MLTAAGAIGFAVRRETRHTLIAALGARLDRHFGLPAGNHQREWAVGMKVVVELPADSPLQPGTVLHTIGYPEPEIFGFLYVYPDRVASLGIFVPSWFDSPARTASTWRRGSTATTQPPKP